VSVSTWANIKLEDELRAARRAADLAACAADLLVAPRMDDEEEELDDEELDDEDDEDED
jgi:hypothetical protein